MKRVNEIKKNKKRIRNRIISMITAGLICITAFSAFPGKAVYAEGESTEATTAEGEEEKKEDNILAPDTGRVEFWEWRRVDGNNIRSLFDDNKFHPVMFCMYKFYNKDSKATGNYRSYLGTVKDTENATTNTSNKIYITPGDGKTKYEFLSCYADKDHYFLPTKTDRVNNYKSDFKSVSSNLENEVLPSGFLGLLSTCCGKEEHSSAYYINCEENLMIKADSRGTDNAISQEDFDSTRFFTKGDSMGVPWVQVVGWGPDAGRSAIKICFPTKQMKTEEAMVYQPGSSEFYLYSAAYHTSGDGAEPTMYIKKGNNNNGDPLSNNDWWHWVIRGNNTYIMAYNDGYRNEVSDENFGSNIYTGQTDSALFASLGNQDYPYVAIGSQSAYFATKDGHPWGPMQRSNSYFIYRPFIGTPHLFTSITTRTIPAGKLYPISNEAFMKPSDEDESKSSAAQSEGIIIPKDETLTINGTVSVSCKLINNGRIVVKKGGTLIVKKGGTIFPYTKLCSGQGTIECDGGNVVIMEGGYIYGFNNFGNTEENPYNQTNAPLRLVGGGTLINYGNLVLSYGVVDKGSKIENRGKGQIMVGYNRKDALELNPNLTTYLSKSSPANYTKDAYGEVTIGLFPVRPTSSDQLSVGTLYQEKGTNLGLASSDLVKIDLKTAEY